jgi:dihydropteroate synthase
MSTTKNSRDKNTIFSVKQNINCRGKLVRFDKPLIMGILNVTEDSFFDGGKHNNEKQWLLHIEKMLLEGADIIDIGAASTRPGAKLISKADEISIIERVLKSVRKEYPEIIISIDTYYANVAKYSIENGADIINDISGGEIDNEMFRTIADLKVPYILMHMKGTPENMNQFTHYNNIIQEMILYFSEKVNKLKLLGVNDIIIDPGFGFSKTLDDNYKLMNQLEVFHFLELPVLVGISRKSMINKVLETNATEALNGTTVLNTIALQKGANILRVHDVKEAVETLKILNMLNKN